MDEAYGAGLALAAGQRASGMRKMSERERQAWNWQNSGAHGRVVRVDPMKPKLKTPGTEPLKLKCDILLSTSAFKFNLRRYTTAVSMATAASMWRWRWRCRTFMAPGPAPAASLPCPSVVVVKGAAAAAAAVAAAAAAAAAVVAVVAAAAVAAAAGVVARVVIV